MSNRRKRIVYCAQTGCRREATIQVTAFNNDGTDRGSRWLCEPHAVQHAHGFTGRIFGDAQCRCGHIDHIINQAGRTKAGEL